jgi:hypothetical protein
MPIRDPGSQSSNERFVSRSNEAEVWRDAKCRSLRGRASVPNTGWHRRYSRSERPERAQERSSEEELEAETECA